MNYLEAVCCPDQTVNPLFCSLGVVIEHVDQDKAVLRLPPNPNTVQGGGIVAGGILATMLDEAMAHAAIARCHVCEGKQVATTNLEVRFFRPAKPGDEITATATVIKPGSRIVFLEAVAVNQDGQPLAKGSATFLVLG